jgi:ABC-2 type transport system ATP-binding protein
LIRVENVTKRYGQRLAVDRLDFTVNKGEILGFLGPNGAGKSTTMNIITGYLSATEGTVTVDGHDILEEPEAAKRQIGYLPELPPLYPAMTVRDFLAFVCDIKRVPRGKKAEDIHRVLGLLSLEQAGGRLIKNLSKGFKQRVGVAQALIGSPPLLILDEPTIGLDPQQIIETRNLIRGLGKDHTIILSSHILPEVAAVCDRVIIINKGRIVASGTPADLSKGIVGDNTLSLRVAGTEAAATAALSRVSGIESVQVAGSREPGTVDLVLKAAREDDIRRPVFHALAAADLPILTMKTMDVTLEDIFLNLITEEKEVG